MVLVVALVAGGVATWRYDLLDRWLDDEPEAPVEPAAIAPPPGLDLPPVDLPEAVARPLPERPRLDRAAIRRAVQSDLSDRDLGRHVLAVVAPLGAGGPAYTLGSGLAVPASTTKVVTSAAALYALGADHVFETTVVPDGRRRVVLVGGGDPLLASTPDTDETAYPPRADVVTLANRTAKALRKKGIRAVRLGLRRRAVHRSRREPELGARLHPRRRRLPDQRALGRRGQAGVGLRPGGRPGRGGRRGVRHRARQGGRPGRGGARGDRRPRLQAARCGPESRRSGRSSSAS